MNLNKLFDTQRILDARIEKEHPRVEGEDRSAKKILALQVELGECANEWRGFKFWSTDQEPRIFEPNPKAPCKDCKGEGYFDKHKDIKEWIFCNECDGVGYHYHNPLLEEYVDCLHFILSIGIEIDFDIEDWVFEGVTYHSLITQFIALNELVSDLFKKPFATKFVELLETFIGLGEMLGFEWEQVEEAYFTKNKINHVRQNEGY